MTGPVGPPGAGSTQQATEQLIVERLFHVLPPGWRSVVIEVRAMGRHREYTATVAPMIGAPGAWDPPADLLDKLVAARAASYSDGTWFGMWLRVDFPLESRFAYNVDQQPQWSTPPPAHAFAEELAMFPRSAGRTPPWLRDAAAAATPVSEGRWPLDGEPPLSLFSGRHLTQLPAGTEVDRFGTPAGNLCFTAGTPYPQRSLPPDQLGAAYHRYRLRRPVELLTGTAVPWFGQPGGGTGFYLPGAIAALLADGTLAEVRHRRAAAPWPPDPATGSHSDSVTGSDTPGEGDPAEPQWPFLPLPTEPPLSLLRDPELIDLPAGTHVEHYGGPDGNLVFVAGTAFAATSLPTSWRRREVMHLVAVRSLRVVAGTTRPWFDQPGGGAAFYLPMAILGLLADGSLTEAR